MHHSAFQRQCTTARPTAIQCRLDLFVSAGNELAQYSNTLLVLVVAIAACFRNPPPASAPPVKIRYRGIHVMLYGNDSHVICPAAVFLTCPHQHVVDVLGSSKSCSAVAAVLQIYCAKTKHINIVMYIVMPIAPRVVRKTMN